MTGAERMRLWRQRQRRGLAVYRIALRENATIEALIEAGRLTEDEALEPEAVNRVLARLLADAVRSLGRRAGPTPGRPISNPVPLEPHGGSRAHRAD